MKKLYNSLNNKGYAILKDKVSFQDCLSLEKELSNSKFDISPYRCNNKKFMTGVTRSPFIISKIFRDLLLTISTNELCEIYFPSGFQLHLSRAVTNGGDIQAFTKQIHRDIPYIHTPSFYPLSLSFLTFISEYSNPQLRIWPQSHKKKFYTFHDNVPTDLIFKQGETLVFDSNLIHCTLPSRYKINYVLHMFSSPIIKPIVEYSSTTVLKEIHKIPYKVSEIISVLGHQFKSSVDDYEYLERH